MKFARMSLSPRSWEEKICGVCAKFLCDKVHAVMSKRMDKRSHAWPRGNLS